MDKETALKSFLQRCFDARVPVYLVCQRAGVSRNTPSKWKKRPDMIRASTLKKLEVALEWFEAVPAVCGICDRRNIDPTTWSCTFVGCQMQRRKAA